MSDAPALVIGASSEIGRAVAAELDSLGRPLILWGRDRERLELTAARCRSRCHVDEVDVTDDDAVRAALAGRPPGRAWSRRRPGSGPRSCSTRPTWRRRCGSW